MKLEQFEQLMDLVDLKISNAIKDVMDRTNDSDHLDEAELEAKVRETLIGENNAENVKSKLSR